MTRFTLDGRDVDAAPGETIWTVARREGTEIPHLCHLPQPGYRPDGNCRACLVEVEGERALVASCIRAPREGMVVRSATARAQAARRMVFELLMSDMPSPQGRDATAPFARWAARLGVTGSRFAPDARPAPDLSHPAMAVALDACIACGLCERACREVQHNDVIGLARRGADVTVAFDLLDPMGASSCVACGECVQACPTGALLPKSVLDARGHRGADAVREVASVCPYCGVGCQVGFRVRDERIVEVVGREWPFEQGPAVCEGALRLRLPGASRPADAAAAAHRGRGEGSGGLPRPRPRAAQVPRGELGGGAGARRRRAARHPRRRRAGCAGRLRQRQGLERGGLPVPEAGAHRLRHQQCRSLHAAVPCEFRRGAAGGHRLRCRHRPVHGGRAGRCHPGDRRAADREPPRRRHLHQAGGGARRDAGGGGPARHRARPLRAGGSALRARRGCRAAQCDAACHPR